jgi:hypothetical protein
MKSDNFIYKASDDSGSIDTYGAVEIDAVAPRFLQKLEV